MAFVLLAILTVGAVSAGENVLDNSTISCDDSDILDASPDGEDILEMPADESDDALKGELSDESEIQKASQSDVLQVSENMSEEVLAFSTSKIGFMFPDHSILELDGENDFWIINDRRVEFPEGSSIMIVAKDLNTGIKYKDALPVESFVCEYGYENVHYMIGLASFKKIPLTPGHKISFKVYYVSPYGKAKYLGKDTVKVKKIKNIIHHDFNSHIYSKQKLTAVCYKSDGKFASGIEVDFYINGKLHQRVKTDSQGVATFDLPDKVGKFTYWIDGSGYDSILKINHCLKISKLKVKKSAKKVTVKVLLKKINGKFKKGQNITLKFNKKKYKAKTNKKGVAKFVIKKPVLKKLKVGKMVKIKATYLKDSVKTKVKVQR